MRWSCGEGSTTAELAATTAHAEAEDNDLPLSVRESFERGACVGAGLPFVHWHELPSDDALPLQQQHEAVPPQQRGDDAATLWQQGRVARFLRLQCGQAGVVWQTAVGVGFGVLPQSQAIRGRVSTGTSNPASQTTTLAVMLFAKRMQHRGKS